MMWLRLPSFAGTSPRTKVFLSHWLGWYAGRGVAGFGPGDSIPLTVADEVTAAPNLIQFLTFVVILITLVVQGLTLG